MNEKLNQSEQSREKQKLMSEALGMARDAVDKLSDNNFTYIDSEGVKRIKRHFTWTEFAPKDTNNKKLLDKNDVLGALGVDTEDKMQGNYYSRNGEDGALEEIWPTLVPKLNYKRIQSKDSRSDGQDYFVIETLSDWNKRMWDQPDADKKADEYCKVKDHKNNFKY